jgi:hypothetical protein
VQRDGFFEPSFPNLFILSGQLVFFLRRKPVPQVRQNLPAPVSQVDVLEFPKVIQIRSAADFMDDAVCDLFLMQFDQVNKLPGQHICPRPHAKPLFRAADCLYADHFRSVL